MAITDKLLEQYFDIKEEKYNSDNKLISIKYSTDFEVLENNYVIFDLENKRIKIQGNIICELLQIIYDKCKDLGF